MIGVEIITGILVVEESARAQGDPNVNITNTEAVTMGISTIGVHQQAATVMPEAIAMIEATMIALMLPWTLEVAVVRGAITPSLQRPMREITMTEVMRVAAVTPDMEETEMIGAVIVTGTQGMTTGPHLTRLTFHVSI